MNVRTMLMCTVLPLALVACGASEEERAADRAPGGASAPAAQPSPGSSEPPLADSNTQTGSTPRSNPLDTREQSPPAAGTQSDVQGTARDQGTEEQQRVGPRPSELTLDPAVPPPTTGATTDARSAPPPTDAGTGNVGEEEALARCRTLTGTSKEECERNVQRGFERATDEERNDSQGEDDPARR